MQTGHIETISKKKTRLLRIVNIWRRLTKSVNLEEFADEEYI